MNMAMNLIKKKTPVVAHATPELARGITYEK